MTRPLVYVAGPVTGDPWGCVRRATRMAHQLDQLGFDAYLAQVSVLHEIVDPQPYERWISLGFNMLARCDGLIRLPGDSPGADREVNHALELGLPVLSHHDDLKEWASYVRAQHAYRMETES